MKLVKWNIMYWVIILLVVVGTLTYGMFVRTTFTDRYREGNWTGESYHNCYTAALDNASFVANSIGFMEEELPDLPYCIKCRPISDPVISYDNMRYEVEVLEVFRAQGDISVGDHIWISRAWSISRSEDKEQVYLELNFRNVMKQGSEYMVFLEGAEDMKQSKYPDKIYRIPDYSVAPFFAYEDGTNVYVTPASSENTYIPYSEVSENEIFASNEAIAEIYLQAKKRIINTYDEEAGL